MSVLTLVPIDFNPQRRLLSSLAASLQDTFRLPTRIQELELDLEKSFDFARGQYNSTYLLSHLLGELPKNCSRILGITSVDLFIPILTYVFGEAQLDGRAAVVSTYRLQNEAYGIEGKEDLLLFRLEKEAIHELGHTYGLFHCANPRCVMRSSTYVEQIDLKTKEFCAECQELLREQCPPQC